MKRHGDLWPTVVSWRNLALAARKAGRGKRRRDVVLRFDFDLERELLRLQREFVNESYQPGPFTTHQIQRPKFVQRPGSGTVLVSRDDLFTPGVGGRACRSAT